jgi:PAS domain S-box-containing protein
MTSSVQKSSAQKAAEATIDSFRADLGPFVVATDRTRMPMVFLDAETPSQRVVFANDSFLALSGYGREELLGRRFDFLLVPDGNPLAMARLDAMLRGRLDGIVELCCRQKSGVTFWAEAFISPVEDENGHVVQYFLSLVDLTRHKEEQAKAVALIDELNHRVKNTLAIVQSIVSQVLRAGGDTVDMRNAVESRLTALSRSHDLLTAERWEGTDLGTLIDTALEPFMTAPDQAARMTVSGEAVRLSPKVMLALGTALHELATNAVKYGALSNPTGSILVTWHIAERENGRRLLIEWRETGGPPVMPRLRKGFGSRVIEAGLAHELRGTVALQFHPDGVACVIDVPAPVESTLE